MPNSLELDDDLDPVELQQSLEAAFDFRFSDPEAAACQTVGDIYAILTGRFATARDEVGRCVTAMAFYRLRRALSGLGIDTGLRPGTPLKGLSPLTIKSLLVEIGTRTGLRLPRHGASLPGTAGALSVFAGFLGLMALGVVGLHFWPVPLLTAIAGFILIWIDPGQLPADCQTIGDLAQKLAALNFGKLVAEGAEPREKHLWEALLEVLSENSLTPKSEIHPDTLLLRKQFRAG